MIIDGVELFHLFQREAPDGSVYLAGLWGSAAVAIVRDEAKPNMWRVIVTDPCRESHRDGSASRARAISAPVDEHGWYEDDSMNDEIPADCFVDSEGSNDDQL
ncbi:hypothetical protein [Bradyrhizobium zhanjiangense]|uniref:Uncharacterized protein n=1 Tax=Bradyrhizobium zhanjiangense TaxID=1325107 RepID=A0ABY0DJT8_9BRAD|nr:hypothetical protein [Bradyrhizobium zhanjiangense]RXG93040.1 hypothetical protein EAS62_20295 [Bradyrhizobium zhanjiangense]